MKHIKHSLLLLGVLLFSVFVAVNTRASESKKSNSFSIPDSSNGVCPILLGEPLPEIVLKTLKNKPYNLNAAIHEKPAVLIFFRGSW